MISTDDFKARRSLLAAAFHPNKLDSLLVTALSNIRYLSGFTGSNGILCITPSESVLFTDPRYAVQSAQEVSCKAKTVTGPLLPAIARHIKSRKFRNIGFEQTRISFNSYNFLRENLPLGAVLLPQQDLIESLRMVKSPSEVDCIRRAVHTNSKAFQKALHFVRPGVTESALAAEIDYYMRRYGATGPAFETIVASGYRAALPHARPSSHSVASNQLLLIDMGAVLDGYSSDMTRTVFLGRPAPKWKKAYNAVLEAQLAAISAVRQGVRADKPDLAARKVLKKSGLDRAFTHSTGHGLGLEIHEPPRLGRKEKTILQAGMVITIEPGIYIEGEGGIRIEDTVLVTANGCEILTPTSKTLTII
ncbi:MAG: Xaa-Pro peptidase family protein [Bryobacterales bacterium]|nr:Xaa-Pro peptidase family protein [Bryobacterales bacterium]